MAASDSSTMQHLEQARNAALENVSLYPQVMGPILGLVASKPSLGLRRWVAAFIAEALASPSLAADEKQSMALSVLPVLKQFLETPDDDAMVQKSAIQAAATIYPLIFRHIINAPDDSANWQIMTSIKSNILQRMDSAPPGVRICCIKFVQRVVHTQTPGVIADPRRPDQNEISLALVPRHHPLIPPSNLEAETSGLLDRLLGVLQDNSCDILLVTATLNCLGALVKTRATIAGKIINSVLMFNPLKFATSPITSKTKIILRSLERTIRALLVNVLKRTPNHPMNGRMQAYMERLQQARITLFEEASKKRPAPSDPVDEADAAKRQRMGEDSNQTQFLALPAGPVSVAQLFTLTNDPGAQNFNVQNIPHDTVIRILVPMLQSIDRNQLEASIETIRNRYIEIGKAQIQQASLSVEDDDDYEPDYQPIEDAEQLKNRLEMESEEDLGIGIPKPSQMSLGTFNLPPPLPLVIDDLERLSISTMDRILRRIDSSPTASTQKAHKAGYNRLAASSNDRQSLVVTYSRLITRPTAGLDNEVDSNGVHSEMDSRSRNGAMQGTTTISDRARQQLLQYILRDWTHRMDIATTWLTEEWYNDRICREEFEQSGETDEALAPRANFPIWARRFMDDLAAFLGGEHARLLIRFVSELAGVEEVLDKVKRLALDPERVTMVVSTLHYLTLYRPPVRDICLDALEDLWRNYDGAKGPATSIMRKFRPQVLELGAA